MSDKEKVIKKKIEEVQIVYGAFGGESDCVGVVEKVDIPKEGGIFTKYLGCNYLFKGFPDVRVVDSIYSSKRIVSGLMILFTEKWVKFFLGMSAFCFLLLPRAIKRKILISFWEYFLMIAYMPMMRFVLPEIRYCVAVREVYRALGVMFGKIMEQEMLDRLRKTRDVFSMILEYDYAYRARFQDILPLLDKKKLIENPRKEINKILDIFIEREAVDGDASSMVTKWKGLKRILNVVLMIKEFREFIVKLLLEIDLDKIKFDEVDFYYVCDRIDYLYCGLSHEVRMIEAKKLDEKMGNKRPKVVFKKAELNKDGNVVEIKDSNLK